MENLETELSEIISTALECDKNTININSGLGKHFQWDSLAHITIMIALENKFNIEVTDENIEQLLTFTDIMEYLKVHGK